MLNKSCFESPARRGCRLGRHGRHGASLIVLTTNKAPRSSCYGLAMLPPRCLYRHPSIFRPFQKYNATHISTLQCLVRSSAKVHRTDVVPPWSVAARRHAGTISARLLAQSGGVEVLLPEGVKVYEADPITEQKSVFVGRACKLSDPSHVGSTPCPNRNVLMFVVGA